MRTVYVSALLWVCACHYDVELRRGCSPDAVGCSETQQIRDAGQSSPPFAAVPFAIEIRSRLGQPVRGLQQACDGTCQELTAIAIGGTAPYLWHWENGGSSPERNVCTDPPHTLRIEATDSANPAKHAAAEVPLMPSSCPGLATNNTAAMSVDSDAGSDEQGPNTTVPGCEPLTWQPLPDELITESIEGPPRACQSADGMTFVEGQTPWPLHAGQSVTLHAKTPTNWLGRWRLELWGSSGGCALDEKLGELSVSAAVSRSVTFTPQRDHAALALRVVVNVGRLITPMIAYELCSN